MSDGLLPMAPPIALGQRTRRSARRHARLRVKRPWRVMGRLACAAFVGAAMVGVAMGTTRYHRAQSAAAQAAAEMRAGRYASAAAAYRAADAAWPWRPAAGSEALHAQALADSSRAFAAGTSDLGAARFAAAIASLGAVRPDDIHHAVAARDLAALRVAVAEADRAAAAQGLGGRLAAHQSAFAAALQQATSDLLPAWEQYGFGDAAPYEHAAAAPVAAAATAAEAVLRDAAGLGNLGSGAAERADLRQWQRAAGQVSAQAITISGLLTDDLTTMLRGDNLSIDAKVPTDISAINADSVSLRVDEAASAAAASRYSDAVGRALVAELGPHATVAALVGGPKVDSAAAVPACTTAA